MSGSLKRFIASLLIFFCMNLYLPRLGYTQQTAAQINRISSVESVSTPEADIPEPGSNFKWWMVVLGVVLIGAVAAMAGGGGGGSNSSATTPSNTGNVAVTW
jgi:hypothetical protein